MKKGNLTILASVLAIALVATAIGMGTMAYFSDIATVTGNTFTAGYLDVKISRTYDGTYKNDLNGIWVSPSNWAPGDTFDGYVYFRNDGNVPVQVVLVDLNNYIHSVGDANFWDYIEVESYIEFALPTTNYAPYMDDSGWLGNGDGTLTLHELLDTTNDAGSVGNCDNILYRDFDPPDDDPWPACPDDGLPLMGNTYLRSGQTGWLYMKFKFSNDAPNDYQNAVCSFDLKMTFVQGPDSGVCRHELPGWIPFD